MSAPEKKARKASKPLAQWGSRGERRVIVVKRGKRFVVERYVDGTPIRKTFADREVAVAWAERWFTSGMPTVKVERLTLRGLLRRYVETTAQQQAWRGRTLLNVRWHVKRIEEALGPELLAEHLSAVHLDTLWARLTDAGMATNQVRAKAGLLRRALAWAHSRQLVSHNQLAGWRTPKVTPHRPGEFTPEDTAKLLAVLPWWDATTWRPWAAIMLTSSHGPRISALLHVRWEDIDWEAGTITFQAEHDKRHRTWTRPLTWDGLAALLTARWHHQRLRKDSPWVFYGLRDRPWTVQAALAALGKAEDRAGIAHEHGRGYHGFRRQAATTAAQRMGDPRLGMWWIGDQDIRQAVSYLKERDEEMQLVADALDRGAR